MRLCWCDKPEAFDSRTGSPLCYRFGTGIWHVYESTPFWPLSPLTDTRVAALVLRVKVLRSTHNLGPPPGPIIPVPGRIGDGDGDGDRGFAPWRPGSVLPAWGPVHGSMPARSRTAVASANLNLKMDPAREVPGRGALAARSSQLGRRHSGTHPCKGPVCTGNYKCDLGCSL
jgi:hypothetical protein